MAKISDYSILDILQASGVETAKIGNSTVCRCPVCHAGAELKHDGNHEAQINLDSNTLYCHSCAKTYTRTELVELFNLYDILDIPRYENKYRQSKKVKTPVIPEPIERLLSVEIPPILWDRAAENFKNIKLTKWNGENRLLFTAPNGSTIIRNAGDIKWKWAGTQPIFNRLTGKNIIFLASGVAEWLISDWLRLDYIVLPSDSKRAALADFKEQLKDKAVIVLQDKDASGSFNKVIETALTIAERVHIVNFYDDKDFRDYCRRTAPAFDTKEQFIDSLLYNIFIELGGNESTEQVTESDIYQLIPVQEQAEPEQEPEPDPDLFDMSKMFVKPAPLKFIFKGFRENTVGIFAGTGGVGKSYMALAFLLTHADTTCKLNYLNLFENKRERRGKCGYISLEDDNELIHHRLYNLRQFFSIKQTNTELLQNLKIKGLYGKNFNLAEKNFNKIEINKEAEEKLYNFCKDKKFVVIDTLRRMSNLNENDSSEMSYILRTIEKISCQTGCSILINSHVSKSKENDGKNKVRGSGSITDDTRFTMILSKNKNELTLSWEKVNAVKIPEPIPLVWQEWIAAETFEKYSMIVNKNEDEQEYAEI